MIVTLVVCGVIFNVTVMVGLCVMVITRFNSLESRLYKAFELIEDLMKWQGEMKGVCSVIEKEHSETYPRCKEL